ncbi:peptidylprolyl isomerase SurA [Candidatus Erwinia haradaeae]|uniref:Chaperone SurA n=1 Tax=Candidatus Erwinia haradaeae TaxID=1922217 RepID=A0A803GD72_9GAMM|nr:peptidylprolyl isomerase SurA [Candidatus Erwinia haradaeae]VFP88798.1 Chaperone SurA [Candidatus Erwinia haradaeae]
MTYWKVLIFGAGLISSTVFSSPQVVDQIVAVVNNSVVLKSDVDSMIQFFNNEAIKTGKKLPENNVLYHHVLEQLIINNILLQKAKQLGFHINDSKIDDTIYKIAKQQKMNVSQFIRSLSDSGINYNAYYERIRNNLMVLDLRANEVRRRFSILPQEINSLASYLELQNNSKAVFKLSHILFPLSEHLTQKEALSRESIVSQLVKRLKNGSHLDQLITAYSSDMLSLTEEDMGWRTIKELPSLFSTFLIKAHKGDVIGPIKSGIGWHVLKVNDIHGNQQRILSKEVYIRDIFIKSSPILSDAQIRAKLLKISSVINNSKMFRQVTQGISQDFPSEYNSRDLGWRPIEEFEDVFQNMFAGLKNSQVSKPIHSDSGWHIIQLLDSRVVDRTDMAQKEQAYQLLLARKLPIATLSWMEDERDSAYVKIHDQNN